MPNLLTTPMMLGLIFLTGCASVSDSALCTGLRPSLERLVGVVLDDGADSVVAATDGFVVKFDAGCGG